MMTDPIANLLTVIRNANRAADSSKHKIISVPSSKLLFSITEILIQEGYIVNHRITFKKEEPKKLRLEVLLTLSGKAPILGLKRISKPGIRIYTSHKNLPRVLNNFGIAIISTSKGIMTNKKAKKLGLGGEVLAYVW